MLLCVRISITSLNTADTVGTLTSVPEATNGVLAVCTGNVISLVCTHSNVAAGFSRWIVPGVSQCIVAHDGTEPDPCGEFTFSMVSDTSGPALTSTAQTMATESLDGTVVVCRAGGLLVSPLVGNITIRILGKNLASLSRILGKNLASLFSCSC